jgi:hypothetical protein
VLSFTFGYNCVKLAAHSPKSGARSEEPASVMGLDGVGYEDEPAAKRIGVATVVCVETVVEVTVAEEVVVCVVVAIEMDEEVTVLMTVLRIVVVPRDVVVTVVVLLPAA